jgi:hypothetical protein
MTTTKADLVDAFDRFTNGLAWLEGQPGDAKARAAELREHMCAHLTRVTDSMAGKRERCPTHPTSFKHRCSPCRSEQIGRADWDQPSDQPMPPTPPEAREFEARRLGEELP